MECYFALKGKEILSCATTWTSLKDIMSSEISQTRKDKYYNDSYEVSNVVKFIETDRMVATRGWEEGGMESCYLMGKKF